MKLSDIDDMKRLAEEYKITKVFYDFVSQRQVSVLKMEVTDQHNMSGTINISSRSTDGRQFFADLADICKTRKEVLQTKLALYGVDKFE